MDDYLAFAQDLARQCGAIIKDNFNARLTVELKGDHSPVTQIDKQINDLVISSIRQRYPEHGVLGEESSSGTGAEALQWLCDPLDGTAAFIIGMQHATFILGLTRQGQLELSVVYNPFTDHLYHAVKGQGAFCNGEQIHVNSHVLNEGYALLELSAFGLYDKLMATGVVIDTAAGAGYRSVLLAQGGCSAIIQGAADNHDVGPSSLIVEEAGGRVSDFAGNSLRYDQPLVGGVVLSNGVCHDELLVVVLRAF